MVGAVEATLKEKLGRDKATPEAHEGLSPTPHQLVQAQRMEALGRLAAGISHDFNNLLTIIGGRSQLLLSRLPAEASVRRDVELIGKTTERAAALTRQLLAFSRQQALQPKVLDLNTLVAHLEPMLRPLIREDIELTIALDSSPACVKADSAQLDQVLLNLAVNARDAMPQEGRLRIETANVELTQPAVNGNGMIPAGSYVIVTVTDTGCGMDAETRSRIFEPFFTTKEKGRGTGLGLAMVFGIVTQSDGHISVESEPGRGSAFKVYLPRADEARPEPIEAHGERPSPGPVSQTVLLVEDEEELREIVCEMLQGRGHIVLTANHGVDALEVAARHEGPIDLLLTDVVMPKMSGRELVDRIRAIRPGLPVLYMSGYTDDAIVRHGVLDPGTALLEKPFTTNRLLSKVRQVLDTQSSGTPSAEAIAVHGGPV